MMKSGMVMAQDILIDRRVSYMEVLNFLEEGHVLRFLPLDHVMRT
jgi:hypothetical protein